jgi:hypothetical protein
MHSSLSPNTSTPSRSPTGSTWFSHPDALTGTAIIPAIPNLWWDGPYDLIARRAIRAGEELTNEYATSTAVDGFTMTCECRTSVCRGLVCGDDWMRSDLQARYDGHCVPLLLAGSRSVGRGPHDDRHPVSRLGTLEGGEGACSSPRNSPG